MKNSLKTKFKNRELIYGGWVSYSDPSIAETFALAGFDFVAIDMEHTCISLEQANRIITACNSRNVSCLPRPTSHSNDIIKPLLEAGGDGMLFPMVENLTQFKEIIERFKYFPIGKRSYGVNRAHAFGMNFDRYISEWNESGILILQIESIQGVKELGSFLKSGHVDGVMVGPYDLSGSLGVPGQLDSPLLKDAELAVIKTCNDFGVSCITQIASVSKEAVKTKIDMGYNGIILSSDLFILTEWAKDMKIMLENDEL